MSVSEAYITHEQMSRTHNIKPESVDADRRFRSVADPSLSDQPDQEFNQEAELSLQETGSSVKVTTVSVITHETARSLGGGVAAGNFIADITSSFIKQFSEQLEKKLSEARKKADKDRLGCNDDSSETVDNPNVESGQIWSSLEAPSTSTVEFGIHSHASDTRSQQPRNPSNDSSISHEDVTVPAILVSSDPSDPKHERDRNDDRDAGTLPDVEAEKNAVLEAMRVQLWKVDDACASSAVHSHHTNKNLVRSMMKKFTNV